MGVSQGNTSQDEWWIFVLLITNRSIKKFGCSGEVAS